MNPVILFEPDGYLIDVPKLMGRQAAGNGFLRAAVMCRDDGVMTGFTPFESSAEAFRKTIAALDPQAQAQVIPAHRQDLVARVGLFYRPDPAVAASARSRLRVGPAAYSICGVTHTLSGAHTLDGLAGMLTEPLMPWDAVVCTSEAAKTVVETVLAHEAEYLAWRTGHPSSSRRPMLPIIPLGVHCADFDFDDADRVAGRAALGLAEDEVAAMFAGRFSIAGKAHPYATFTALQTVQRETGRKLALILAGYTQDEQIAQALSAALRDFCPDVRVIYVEGRDRTAYRHAWAGADLFVSLADSIQESFGLTPIEAMAAGLPALVSDWNGYKDTVRDGLDGFRIRTWAPGPGAGVSLAEQYECGQLAYGAYLSRANTAVVVDLEQLTARLRDLVCDPDLRRRLGAAGRQRARELFDWPGVYRRYQALWDEQTAIRTHAQADAKTRDWLAQAPRTSSDHMGLFDTFAGFPTAHITGETLVRAGGNIGAEIYAALITKSLTNLWVVPPALVARIADALAGGPVSVGALASGLGISEGEAAEVVARLAKIGVLEL